MSNFLIKALSLSKMTSSLDAHCMWTVAMYIYIYKEKEREREIGFQLLSC